MGGIFICYRRDDTAPYARLLSESLAGHFGRDAIYRDLDSMGPGVDFPKAVRRALETCDAMLALIGPSWLATGPDGTRRLDDPADHVRGELAAALRRDDVLVVPVLIEATRMPKRTELPEDLGPLADRNAHRLADEGWADDLENLVEALEAVVHTRAAPPPTDSPRAPKGQLPAEPPGGRRRRIVAVAGALVLVVGVAVSVTIATRTDTSGGARTVAAVAPCSFGSVRISATPRSRFDGGFFLGVRLENIGERPMTVPTRRDVHVLNAAGAVLQLGQQSTWNEVFPTDVPPGASFDRTVAVLGEVGELPAPGSRVSVRVEDVYATGIRGNCTVAVDGVPVP